MKTNVTKYLYLYISGLDVLVNNAGALDFVHAISETQDDLAQKYFTLNFFAPLALTREALPLIRKVKGNIIYMSSIVGKLSILLMSRSNHKFNVCKHL